VPLFDAYLIVDWSAAAVPRRGPDSIWFCHLVWTAGNGGGSGRLHEAAIENPPTRREAEAALAGRLAEDLEVGRATLIGFDFPIGYPAGFAARLAGPDGTAMADWRTVWQAIDALLEDGPDNANNRFAAAAELNRRASGTVFPFWGCPAHHTSPHIAPTSHRAWDREGLAEKRLTEERIVGPQPTWKLYGNGSAGGQALTGIPIVRRLREHPAIADAARVWPFETGLRAPDPKRGDERIVFAEIYPSLIEPRPEPGEVKDRAQVRALARRFAELDAADKLAPLFVGDPALTDEERARVEREEAWILGVTDGQRRAASPRRQKPTTDIPSLLAGEGQGGGYDRTAVAGRASNVIAVSPPTPSLPRKGGGSTAAAARHAENSPSPVGESDGVRGHAAARLSPSPSRPAAGPFPLPEGRGKGDYAYLRDPAAIYRRSFALIRAETDLSRLPRDLHPVALRIVHAAGDPGIVADITCSDGAAETGRAALRAGAPVLVDAEMVAHGIIRRRLPAANPVLCTLGNPAVPDLARDLGTTRSAAAVELWRPHLAGAVVAIGNAPTALFHLLEMIEAGAAPRPALVLGFAVGFVGAAESKEALIGNRLGIPFVALAGRRGGSAMAAAAVNALAAPLEDETAA
jgi:precorrin-8X/cobalt-precorrin-8 methylmutase